MTDKTPAAAPPADVVADLRRWREDVARILALRRATVADPPAEPAPSDAAPACTAALLWFAEEAHAALSDREPDPIDEAERALGRCAALGPPERHFLKPVAPEDLVRAVRDLSAPPASASER